MKKLVTIDPGLSNGITVGEYSDTEPYRRTHAFQVEGGLTGLLKFLRVSEGYDWNELYYMHLHLGRETSVTLESEIYVPCDDPDCTNERSHGCGSQDDPNVATVVCEKFTPRQALKLDAVEPLRVEGALIALGVMPDYHVGKKNPLWGQPSAQYFCGGKTPAERKKFSREFLKKHDLHLTGKMVGCKDADDAISATLHAFAFLRRISHKPTLNHYFGDEND